MTDLEKRPPNWTGLGRPCGCYEGREAHTTVRIWCDPCADDGYSQKWKCKSPNGPRKSLNLLLDLPCSYDPTKHDSGGFFQ